MQSFRRKKIVTVALLGCILLGMGGLVAVAQPLYEIFCQVTGYGGTTQKVDSESVEMGDREIIVQFNADVAGKLPWRFKPGQREIKLRIGENKLAFYSATNLSNEAISGSATFNVTPQKAGIYFNKIDCFCFQEQVLMPGETVEMPVTFFVDPDIENDKNLDDVRTITLSYTFFNFDEENDGEYVNQLNQEVANDVRVAYATE
tara:strand:- start:3145 stop:3753 length:609 start_codon:yes stop_codon:yes gene_type:complete